MAHSLTKVEKQAVRDSLKRIRGNHEAKFARVERGASVLLTGWGLAQLEKRAILPVQVAGIPSKPVLGVLALFMAAKSTGSTRRMLDAAGEACLANYGYAVGKSGAFVAGEYDEGGGDNDDEGEDL